MAKNLSGRAPWRRRASRFASQTAGSTAVQFAFAMPILVTLTLGALDGGRAMLTFNTLEKLSKDGARFASLRGADYSTPADQPSLESYLKGRANGIDTTKLQVAITWPDGNNQAGSRVAVQVTYPIQGFLLPTQAATFSRTSTLNIMR